MGSPKILLVGVGYFGQNHLRVLMELDQAGVCEFIGVVDKNQKIINEIKKKYNLLVSTNLSDLIDEVDAVDIVTPSNTHYKIAKRCLIRKKHVFVEKPITKKYCEAQELYNHAEQNGKILMVGHIFRYNQAVNLIKSYVENKKFGLIYYMYGHFMGLRDPRTDMGSIYTYATHYVDLYSYLMGGLPEEVTCCNGYFFGRKNIEDAFIMILKYDPNVLGVIEGNWISPIKERNMSIIFSKGSIISDLSTQKITIYDSYINDRNGILKAVNKKNTEMIINHEEPLKLELFDFLNSITEKKTPLVDAASALNSTLIIEKAIESAKLGKSVRIPQYE